MARDARPRRAPGTLRVRRRWPPLLVVGLTGGIASGKSTVAREFAGLGATVVAADAEGRAVVAPGEPALAEIVAAFGARYLLPDGTLDRAALARRAFAGRRDLAVLNRITHPRIARRLQERLRALQRHPPSPPLVILEAAILVEAGWAAMVDRVVVVAVQPCTQVARLIAGSGLTEEEARARVRAQMPTARRLRFADHAICGESPLPEMKRRTREIWDELAILAAPRARVREGEAPGGPPPRKARPR